MTLNEADSLRIDLPDLDATETLGQALARSVEPGTTIVLTGSLGAGKTRLMQAFATALGAPREEVVSPTFVLCRRYDARLPAGEPIELFHLDAYRMEDEDEFLDLGIEEMSAGDGVVCVEWGERFAETLPADRLTLTISVTGETSRTVHIAAGGPLARRVLDRLRGETV